MLYDSHQDRGATLATAGSVAMLFAQPRSSSEDRSLVAKFSGKATRFLARNVRTKSVAMRNTRPLVTFTFDDVPASACIAGARTLEDHDIHATYYVSGGGCGAGSPGGTLATIQEIEALYARGHEIGCHTYSHLAAGHTDAGDLASDLARNYAFLSDSGIIVRNFAYPYGDLSFRAKRLLEARFDSCRSIVPGVNARTLDLGAMLSISLENFSMDRESVEAVVAETVRTTGWLIFSCHDVDDSPSRFGVSPKLLEFAIATARRAGCAFATVAGGLKIVSGAGAA
jgi:peptidoglycan/xylan/chitin deacetylase (PgdA/CDA1 family)